MDRVFAVEEVSDQFWSPSPNIAPDELSKMNRSASEWSFQRFLQQASASQNSSLSVSTSPLSSSSSAAGHQDDVVLVNVKDGLSTPKSTIDPNIKNIKNGSNATASFGVTPPSVPIDSEEYQAFLKSKLHLACAAVASRGSLSKAQESAALADSVSQTFKTSQLGTKTLCKGAGSDSSRSQEKDPNGSLGMQKKSGASLKSTTSGSSKEQTDDDEVEGEIENMDPDDAKRVRRMLSNRESARRSRRRKQAHLTELETQVSQLKVENSSLLKRLTDTSQKYNAAAVDNRVLKADVETLRAKIKMAEETVKRVTGLNPKDHAMLDLSSISISSFGRSPSETLTDAAVPLQNNPNKHLYQPVSSNSVPPNDQSVHSGLKDINSVENMQQISEPTAATEGVNKIGRTSSMQRVASLEHLQKRIRGDGNPCGLQTKSDS